MEQLNTILTGMPWLLPLAVAWELAWKGVALWRAARNRHIAWYVVLLIINLLGILEIIYIFAFSKPKAKA